MPTLSSRPTVATRAWIAAVVVLSVAVSASAPAQAASEIRAAPGQVMFEGDGSQHRLRVTDSLDLAERGWVLGDQAPPGYEQTAKRSERAWIDLAELSSAATDSSDPDGAIWKQAEAAIVGAIAVSPIPALTQKLASLRGAALEMQALDYEMSGINTELRAVQAMLGRLRETELSGGEAMDQLLTRSALLQRKLSSLLEQSSAVIVRMSGLRKEIEGLSSFLRPQDKPKIFGIVSRIISRAKGSQAGFVTLGMLRFIGNLAIFADGVASLLSMTSDHVVVVSDESGTPIDATWPCRNVRTTSGSRVANAASCPAPTLPSTFGVFHGFEPLTGLYLRSGDASDDIQIDLPAARNPFAELFVEGRGGDDTIRGSSKGDRLIGGAGNDTILGRSGDDVIYGDQITTDSGVDPENANDHLFGESGEDTIRGELGDDLVSGGKGDDSDWIGAALSGGDGNDTIVGGPGHDEMAGNAGRDAILAKESDFTISKDSTVKQADEQDDLVDCGPGPGEQYFTATAADSFGAPPAATFDCDTAPRSVPTRKDLLTSVARNGAWPWYR